MSRAVRPWRDAGVPAASGAGSITVRDVPSTAPVASRNAAVAPLPRIAASRATDQVRTRTSFASARESGLKVQVAAAAELADGGRDVLSAHQRLADQHRVDPDALEIVELLTRAEARLGDHGLARRHVGEQFVRALDVDAEVRQVAVVEAEHVGIDVQRQLELALVVDL